MLWLGKCPVREAYVGEMSSRGIVWSGKCLLEKCPSGKCQLGICPQGGVNLRTVQLGNCPTISVNILTTDSTWILPRGKSWASVYVTNRSNKHNKQKQQQEKKIKEQLLILPNDILKQEIMTFKENKKEKRFHVSNLLIKQSHTLC